MVNIIRKRYPIFAMPCTIINQKVEYIDGYSYMKLYEISRGKICNRLFQQDFIFWKHNLIFEGKTTQSYRLLLCSGFPRREKVAGNSIALRPLISGQLCRRGPRTKLPWEFLRGRSNQRFSLPSNYATACRKHSYICL